jgi:bifunctional DNA-binding transcriptional regulator/antitoxin component of YhaV-PrlF toxin-antitoxin module
MNTPETLMIEHGGRITLPTALRDRYGLAEDTPLRIIETSSGILLIPLTGEPMSAALVAELEEWQSLATESFELFPYEDDAA